MQATAILVLAVTVLPAAAQAPATTARPDTARHRQPVRLDSVTVVGGRRDDLIGLATSASQGRVGAVDLQARPMSREGELFESVPGVIVTQHSGDGKANQYFIRGFNLDHGTDFQTRLEGMPINMPSHAHGQGYTDLNFLIPELVGYIDYWLGVYHTDLGDFGSAGGAQFHLLDRLARPFVAVGGGENGLARVAGGGSARVGDGNLLVGAEVKRYDGPWLLPEDLRKVSGLARYSWQRNASRFSILGLAYHNSWHSSDQIPLRAVADGLIGRFGNIDKRRGHHRARQPVGLVAPCRRRFQPGSPAVRDPFRPEPVLGFCLDDPTRGDQFNQRERRTILGGNAVHRQVAVATASTATTLVAPRSRSIRRPGPAGRSPGTLSGRRKSDSE